MIPVIFVFLRLYSRLCFVFGGSKVNPLPFQLGDTPARSVRSKSFILMVMSHGVESGRECEVGPAGLRCKGMGRGGRARP